MYIGKDLLHIYFIALFIRLSSNQTQTRQIVKGIKHSQLVITPWCAAGGFGKESRPRANNDKKLHTQDQTRPKRLCLEVSNRHGTGSQTPVFGGVKQAQHRQPNPCVWRCQTGTKQAAKHGQKASAGYQTFHMKTLKKGSHPCTPQ